MPAPTERRRRARRPSGDRDLLEELHMVERLAAAKNDGAYGIVTHHDRQAGLFAEEHVEVSQERSAAGDDDSLVDDVCRQLGRSLLEGGENGLDDGVNRLGQRLADLVAVDDDGLGDTGDHVAPLDLARELLLDRISVADLDLDALRRLLADGEVVLSLEVSGDRVVHL